MKKSSTSRKSKLVLGWREWVHLPKLALPRIKAKIDSGARTSALHAENIVYFKRGKKKMVRFRVYPHQNDRSGAVTREAVLVEHRSVRSSVGHVTLRPVISTYLEIAEEAWPIEITLVDREIMGFRMLIGRQALHKRYMIAPNRSYIAGNLIAKTYKPKAKRQK